MPQPRTRRDAILLATREAATLHEELGIKLDIDNAGGYVDIFQIITDLRIPLLFRPLNGLLGVAIRQYAEDALLTGILVTTNRSLALQRFTAAHELGHIILEHTGSLDRQVGQRGRLSETKDLKEIAADTFAAELLIPKWLIIHHAKRQNWSSSALSEPSCVYQLSLRLGVSYEATCWGLQAHKLLSEEVVARLLQKSPKASKEQYINKTGYSEPTNPWADVWLLTERDAGNCGIGSPDDLILVQLKERPSSGFLWEPQFASESSIKVVYDQHTRQDIAGIPIDDLRIGTNIDHLVILKCSKPEVCHLRFVQIQPWNTSSQPRAIFTANISLLGRQEPGLPRHIKGSLN